MCGAEGTAGSENSSDRPPAPRPSCPLLTSPIFGPAGEGVRFATTRGASLPFITISGSGSGESYLAIFNTLSNASLEGRDEAGEGGITSSSSPSSSSSTTTLLPFPRPSARERDSSIFRFGFGFGLKARDGFFSTSICWPSALASSPSLSSSSTLAALPAAAAADLAAKSLDNASNPPPRSGVNSPPTLPFMNPVPVTGVALGFDETGDPQVVCSKGEGPEAI